MLARVWRKGNPCALLVYCFLLHSSVSGHLSCLHILAIVHHAAMNLGVQISLQDLAVNSTAHFLFVYYYCKFIKIVY